MITTLPFESREAYGSLYKRAVANFDRLEREDYDPGHLFKESGYGWPGDWEGRTLLAWTLLARSTRREPKYLAQAMGMLDERTNEDGYFGTRHPAGTIDEQQLAGHSWYLRALCEYYDWKRDESVLDRIRAIVRNLLLPAAGHFALYPDRPEQRTIGGAAIGEVKDKVGAWYLSTDIGCAFIMLDGATHAYEMAPEPGLKSLIEEMIGKWMTIDPAAAFFQTHATLSAARGLLRFYESTGRKELLAKVEELLLLYEERGMTDHYANYNWFGRPEWTECCAIVDSFMLAVGLWKHTGNSAHLDAAHHILYNGLGHGQRPNGGFGCDVCLGVKDGYLSPIEEMFEANWCCTMRGGEGLSRAIEYSYWVRDREITLPFYETSAVTLALADGEIRLEQSSAYPIEGSVRLTVRSNTCREPIALRLYVPSWADSRSVSVRIDGSAVDADIRQGFAFVRHLFPSGTELTFEFGIECRRESAFGFHTAVKGFSYRHGPLLLGVGTDGAGASLLGIGQTGASSAGLAEREMEPLGAGRYRIGGTEAVLSPINDLIELDEEAARRSRKLVLFKDSYREAPGPRT
ncbi:beta-L-arabinofuranosidase domain-containing protein [Cohnella zeiphila]|uniref:Glycoside hydrolase family 127 protein n=1 Tax=Cohnella zeiphila TaxID=2761120 RepID=A0A7X0VWC5_9BACL|nr:beta-L-arabinofuranosidase domain-containing protein [Cohnella zeiphila]MBB6730808.1 glycoside hydrolase family 127 protein [Cohnella zeiphila]